MKYEITKRVLMITKKVKYAYPALYQSAFGFSIVSLSKTFSML